MKTWFITGCSSGFGRAIAEAALAAGHRVIATARDVRSIADLECEACRVLTLDVTDAVVPWLDVTLGETLGVGVTVSTIEIVCDGVADRVTLGV